MPQPTEDPWQQLQKYLASYRGGCPTSDYITILLMECVLTLHENVTKLTQLATYLVKDQKDLQIWMKENGLR